MAGLYIHIPFCKQACHYCNFHFSTHTKLQAKLLSAINKEIVLQKDYLGNIPLESVYLGGGTPSMLKDIELETLFTQIKNNFAILPQAEITLEANPDDISVEKLYAIKNLGVNRLSIGVQSFHDPLLQFLNRVHSSNQALESIKIAKKAGFQQFSIDLMYGIPGQTVRMWQHDLAIILELGITHISAYCLTIEHNTVFGHWKKEGKLQPIQEEIAIQHFELLVSMLQEKGYEHYEVSNFCLPGQYSQHNINYWKKGTYLGIGPGAHSYNGTSRQYNVANNPRYIHSILQNNVPSTIETLGRIDHINEYIITSLRTQWGCDMTVLAVHYHYDLQKERKIYLEKLIEQGLATLENKKLILTTRGKLLADKIALDLFIVE